MPNITDEEFGIITLRRSARASSIRMRVAPDGRLRASLPLYAPTFLVKRFIRSSRQQLRILLAQHPPETVFESGMQIGKSHTLLVHTTTATAVSVKRHGQHIIAMLPAGHSITDPHAQRIIRDEVINALRIEAKSYLTRRLAFLAVQHGFSYQKVRFSHASGRWGSCSNGGTISLNIALMKLPFELIDYVLIHELSHTLHMDHSPQFWQCVAAVQPHYQQRRRALKNQSPFI